MSKTKAHQKYMVDGVQVPGVTTIIGRNLGWNKQPLIAWARRTALEGKDPNKVRDQAADRGTLAHALIEEHLGGDKVDKGEWSPADLDVAENAVIAYLEWEGTHDVKVIETEVQLAHRQYKYGGTLDLVAWVDGEMALVDFKTTNGVYAEHRIQLAAYNELLAYHLMTGMYGAKEPAKKAYGPAHLLQLSKVDGSFSHHVYDDLSDAWEVFVLCLTLNNLYGLV